MLGGVGCYGLSRRRVKTSTITNGKESIGVRSSIEITKHFEKHRTIFELVSDHVMAFDYSD